MIKTSQKRAYHHGDLRKTLIAVGVDVIDKKGIDALNLRALALTAGVSSGAPYHHFADRADLLAAIASEGFELLEAAMIRTRDLAGEDSRARLEAMGQAYVLFATSHRGHFRVMFRGDVRQVPNTALEYASESAFQLLCEAIAACQAAGTAPQGDPQPFVLHAWTVVHGLATLWVDESLTKFGSTAEDSALMMTRLTTQMFNALAHHH
eukprot:gene13834-13950_t